MVRKIIRIDEGLCDGCGLCAKACHEGAIAMVDGKAKLIRDDYCDGLGDCLPACPRGAISFEEREAAPYDEAAVRQRMNAGRDMPPASCPGSRMREIAAPERAPAEAEAAETPSMLRQWPVQLKLVPPGAPYFDGADLLIAADCTAYAYGGFHGKFMKNRVTLIGCPKLDEGDYSEKLTAILSASDIKSLTVVRMEVPCCGGIVEAVKRALKASGKLIPWQVVTISVDGEVVAQ